VRPGPRLCFIDDVGVLKGLGGTVIMMCGALQMMRHSRRL